MDSLRQAVGVAGLEKSRMRLYSAMCVTFTAPIGSPMLLLCPNAPLRARPMYAMAFTLSTPIVFEAAPMMAPASCAVTRGVAPMTSSRAAIAILTSMTILRARLYCSRF